MRIVSFLLLLSAVSLSAQSRNDQVVRAVHAVLQAQQEAWNRHDLGAFLNGYWNSPDLTFFSGADARSGWEATRERYRNRYQSAGHEMGKLEFSELNIEPLAD